MTEKLEPCPFCRGKAVEETGEAHTHHLATFMPDSPGYTMISCPACGCAIIRETQIEARQVWNTRTPPPGYVKPSGPCCMDCDLPYSDAGFADLIVPNHIWKIIAPDDGLLCPTCIVRRCARHGLETPAKFASGPLGAWHPKGFAPGYVMVPEYPTEEQWSGLARDIVMWWSFDDRSGNRLHTHLRDLGRDIPEWLTLEIPDEDMVPAKGDVAAAIYAAMLAAAKGE